MNQLLRRPAPDYDPHDQLQERRRVNEALSEMHRRGQSLELGFGNSLIFSSASGFRLSLGVNAENQLIATSVESGDNVEEFILWQNVAGRPDSLSDLDQQASETIVNLQVDLGGAVAAIESAAFVGGSNTEAIAALSTQLTAEIGAQQIINDTVVADISARATIAQLEEASASAEAARAALATSIGAQFSATQIVLENADAALLEAIAQRVTQLSFDDALVSLGAADALAQFTADSANERLALLGLEGFAQPDNWTLTAANSPETAPVITNSSSLAFDGVGVAFLSALSIRERATVLYDAQSSLVLEASGIVEALPDDGATRFVLFANLLDQDFNNLAQVNFQNVLLNEVGQFTISATEEQGQSSYWQALKVQHPDFVQIRFGVRPLHQDTTGRIAMTGWRRDYGRITQASVVSRAEFNTAVESFANQDFSSLVTQTQLTSEFETSRVNRDAAIAAQAAIEAAELALEIAEREALEQGLDGLSAEVALRAAELAAAQQVLNDLVDTAVSEATFDATVATLTASDIAATLVACLLYTSPSPRD